MSCIKCPRPSDFICNCNEVFFCSDHIGEHLRTQGPHPFETLDTPLSLNYSQAINSELKSRIHSIIIAKKTLSQNSKQLINLIKNTIKSVLTELSKLEINYLNLLRCTKVSNSLSQKLDRIIKTEFKLRIFEFDLNDEINTLFGGDLYTEANRDMTIEEVKAVILEEKKEEEFQDCVNFHEKNYVEEDKKVELSENEEIKQSIGQSRNEWSFIKRKEFAEASIGKSFRKANELKFSNDGKYLFKCKNYLGMSK